MAVRQTGWAMLASNSVQEVHDLALIAQAATLQSRVPFLHFFDGFRTSHEVNKIEQLSTDDIRAMIDDELVRRPPRPGDGSRPARAARHGAESGRLLPGPRGGQPVLRRGAGDRAGDDGPVRRADGPVSITCSTTSVPRTPSA